MENRPLRVPADIAPHFMNEDASTGFALGILATPTMRGWNALAAPITGLIAGGMYGKHRQQRELTEGRLVHPPTYLNKHALIGVSDGLIIGGLIGIFTGGAGFIATGLAVGLGLMGSGHGYKRMQNDYKNAEMYVMHHGEFNPHSVRRDGVLQNAQPTLTPHDVLRFQQQGQQPISFTDRLAQEPINEQFRG